MWYHVFLYISSYIAEIWIAFLTGYISTVHDLLEPSIYKAFFHGNATRFVVSENTNFETKLFLPTLFSVCPRYRSSWKWKKKLFSC